MNSRRLTFSKWPFLVSFVVAFGGFILSYVTTIISGALFPLVVDFEFTTFQLEMIVSILVLGALIGTFCGGFLADYFGRKKCLFFILCICSLGLFFFINAHSFALLLIGRFICGLAVGIGSVVIPLYIAEISPSKNRGAFVSMNGFLITIGTLIAYIASYYYASTQIWRQMFLFAFFPIALQFIALFFIPETAAWLSVNHQEKNSPKSSSSWKIFFQSHIRKSLLIGIGVCLLQQITGISAAMAYAPKIFQLAGYQSIEAAFFVTILIGIVNVFFTMIAIWMIDKIGRKPLLISGLIGMGFFLGFLGFSFYNESEYIDVAAAFCLIGYVAFYAASLGLVTGILTSEIFPIQIRGKAIGISTFFSWISNYFVSLTFLTMAEELGAGMTFWIYACICLIGFCFVWKIVPETKGKTLEEIQYLLKREKRSNR